MSSDSFAERGKALEESFFAKRNRELLEQLRSQQAAEAQAEELTRVTGIADASVIQHLVKLGLGSETIAAVSLVPLIQVAWADGKLETKEREAVLSAAREDGIESESPSYRLLQSWLEEAPEPKLMTVWQEYVSSMASSLSTDARDQIKSQLIGRARRVAEASGGLLGLGRKISPEEQRVLDDLQKAFET